MRLAGSHALITGGSHGIGIDIAREFSRRGARVTVLGRNRQRLDEVAAEIGGNAAPVDLADPADVGGAIGRIEADHGPVDVLVNNAAIALVASLTETAPGKANELMAVNAAAPMELCRQVLPGMLARGHGHIVNISSLAGDSAIPDMAVYCASKAALHHYTLVAQRELADTPVNMSLVTFGEVSGTRMMEESRESAVIAQVSARLLKVLPNVSTQEAAAGVADAVERNKAVSTIPKLLAPVVGMRNLPTRLQDIAFIGIKRDQ